MKSIKTNLIFIVISLCLVNCSNKEQEEKCKSDYVMSVAKECAQAKIVYGLSKEVEDFDKKRKDESLDCNALRELYNSTVRQPLLIKQKQVLDSLRSK
jgi:hypothetical protein